MMDSENGRENGKEVAPAGENQEEKPDEKSEEKPEEIVADVIEEVKEEQSEEMRSILEEKPNEIVVDVIEEVKEEQLGEMISILEKKPEEKPAEKLEEKPDEIVADVTEEVKEEQLEEMVSILEENPEEKPEAKLEKKSDEKSEEKPEEIVADVIEEVKEEQSEEIRSILEEKLEENPDEIVADVIEEVKEEQLGEMISILEKNPEEKTAEKLEEKPDEIVADVIEEGKEEQLEEMISILEENPEEKPAEKLEANPDEIVADVIEDVKEEQLEEMISILEKNPEEKPAEKLEEKPDEIVADVIEEVKEEQLEEMISILEKKPEEKRDEKSEETVADVIEEVKEEQSEEMRSILGEKLEEKPEEKPDEIVADVIEEVKEEQLEEMISILEENPEEKSAEKFEENPDEIVADVIEEVKEERLEEMISILEEKPEEKSDEKSEEKPEEIVADVIEEVKEEQLEEIRSILEEKPEEKPEEIVAGVIEEVKEEQLEKMISISICEDDSKLDSDQEQMDIAGNMHKTESKPCEGKVDNDVDSAFEATDAYTEVQQERCQSSDEITVEEIEPVFDGTEVPGLEINQSASPVASNLEPKPEASAWPEKAAALKNLVTLKSVDAVQTLFRRLSSKKDDTAEAAPVDVERASDGPKDCNQIESSITAQKSAWNPLSYIKLMPNFNVDNKADQGDAALEALLQPIAMKGRIILYTKLGCQECSQARLFLHGKRLRYVEINIDIYPSRKLELEKLVGSSVVPRVFFNEKSIGGLSELKELDESENLDEKINCLISKAPSMEAPLPPFSGEDDLSSRGPVDELALIVRKMKPVIVKDRFYKMRRFKNSFLGSEAVDFLSEDQCLERQEAFEVARKLASKLFFQHVLEENLFEDGNHLYRFLDDDPIVSCQCHNIPRGIIDLKPKPMAEIASRLRLLSYTMFEAYTSQDGKHVDYRSIHGSEEFARYLRIIQELHRVEMQDMSREEKLAFFINLYNMMIIHAILVWGHPAGPMERRKLYGDFKYVIGGCTYSLSAIHNGVLRGNRRPPYNIMKSFRPNDKRSKAALPYPEPLIHFALVCGTRSGPALRCYSPGNIDKELMDAARDFLRSGALQVDFNAKVAYISSIFKWYNVDFGRNEMEVLKHASNYVEATLAEPLLELLADTRLKVVYQPYDWGLNN